MEEPLISFETAKLAKEKGFNVQCRCYYTKEGIGHGSSTRRIAVEDAYCEAPSQSLLQKWLREEHGIYIDTEASGTDEEFPRYTAMVYTCGQDRIDYELKVIGLSDEKMEEIKYASYEEALEEGLKNALKLVKK